MFLFLINLSLAEDCVSIQEYIAISSQIVDTKNSIKLFENSYDSTIQDILKNQEDFLNSLLSIEKTLKQNLCERYLEKLPEPVIEIKPPLKPVCIYSTREVPLLISREVGTGTPCDEKK